MKDKENRVYEQPSVEMISVEVESGIFNVSPGGGDITEPEDGNYYEFEIW